ncbi:MAG TPA: hypothetical protein HA362_07340 [Nanoarchaeota archaeon]|nr:hypothetical protein [Nanoarchaeota archaeon]
MALPICFESLLRTVLTTAKVAWDLWFYTIGLIVLLALLKKGKWIAKGLVVIVIIFVLAAVLDFAGISFLCSLLNSFMKWFA